jgi:hypothetical protein
VGSLTKRKIPNFALPEKRASETGGADDSGVKLVVRFGMIFEEWQAGDRVRRYL